VDNGAFWGADFLGFFLVKPEPFHSGRLVMLEGLMRGFMREEELDATGCLGRDFS